MKPRDNGIILYLHGFNSAPASFKARLLQEYQAKHGRTPPYIPELPPVPDDAVMAAEAIITAHAGQRIGLVGSSLGGYYATWLAEKYGLRAVLLNPAVEPYALFANKLGPQQNLYTGRAYEFTAAHVQQLRGLDALTIADPRRYLLIVTTGDEVLDYRRAVTRYHGARQFVIPGGDHSLKEFSEYLDITVEFLGG